jgi:hypothetical protein
MNDFKFNINDMLGKLQAQLVKDRVKFEVVSDLMIAKGLITEEELDKVYADTYEKKWELYTADALGITVEEYRELVQESQGTKE